MGIAKGGILTYGMRVSVSELLRCEQGPDVGGVGSADVQQAVGSPVVEGTTLGVLATEPTPALPTANGIHGGRCRRRSKTACRAEVAAAAAASRNAGAQDLDLLPCGVCALARGLLAA